MTPICRLHDHACPVYVDRDIRCTHDIAVEVWPERAEVYFRDERHTDPANTQVQFDAVVHNAPSPRVRWEVRDLSGNQGQGRIDATGRYTAPGKLPGMESGYTEIISAVSDDDPLRRAFAYVTIVGHGPAPEPVPSILIWPRLSTIYYKQKGPDSSAGEDNKYMDTASSVAILRTTVVNAARDRVRWKIGEWTVSGYCSWIHYHAYAYGDDSTLNVIAELVDHPGVKDTAVIELRNYRWPQSY